MSTKWVPKSILALKSYTRYLELYPRAEDKDKIEKKIEKLRAEVAKSKTRSAS